MSSLIVLSDERDIFLMSDRSVVDSNKKRVNVDVQKLFIIDERIIFCSGFLDVVSSVMNTDLSIVSIQDCVNEFDNPNIEVFILDERGQSYLSKATGYVFSHDDIIPRNTDGVHSIAMGIETEKVSNHIFHSVSSVGFENIKDDPHVFSKDFFDSVEDEKIGGIGDFILLDRKNMAIRKTNIREKRIPRHLGERIFLVVGDAIVGRILAGNSLRIENEGNNFTLDSTGATLNNADFTITTDNGKNRLTLDPSDGIKLEQNDGGTWVDKFYLNSSGDAIFAGQLEAASGSFSGSIEADSGSIGGMAITSDGIDVDADHYIHNDGEIKWGNLSIDDTSATFDGDIYANKLLGTVDWSQITNAPVPTDRFSASEGYDAGAITYGSMNAERIVGGTAQIDGLTTIDGTLQVGSISSWTDFVLPNGRIVMGSGGYITVGGYSGNTVNFSVSTPYGDAVLQFKGGVMIGYYYY